MSSVGEDEVHVATVRPHLTLAPPAVPAEEPGVDLARLEGDRRRDAEAALAGLYRRVLDLEAGSISREATVRELHRRLEEAEAASTEAQARAAELEPLASELEALRHTKTFRWTAGPRRAYGAVLRTLR